MTWIRDTLLETNDSMNDNDSFLVDILIQLIISCFARVRFSPCFPVRDFGDTSTVYIFLGTTLWSPFTYLMYTSIRHEIYTILCDLDWI